MTEIPNNPVSAERYLGLGETINLLENAKGRRLGEVIPHIEMFMSFSKELSFDYPQDSFNSFVAKLWELEEKTFTNLQKDFLSEELAKELHRLMRLAAEIIFKDAKKRQTIVLNFCAVSDRLKNLPHQLVLTESQNHLLHETVRCLECGIYRSAGVMGWNLAYDYIRQWTFNKHLPDFNTALTANYLKKNGQTLYDPINDFNDFMKGNAPSEKTVLDTLFAANKIGGNLHEDLKKHLRQRNQYAHPSDRIPTANQVNSFIEELIDIITRPPFK